jgi:hypothetical protein
MAVMFSNWLAPDSVLRVVGGMHLTHRACRIFVHRGPDLTQHVEQGVFLQSGQLLVSQPCGVEPMLT